MRAFLASLLAALVLVGPLPARAAGPTRALLQPAVIASWGPSGVAIARLHSGSFTLAAPVILAYGGNYASGAGSFAGLSGAITSAQMIDPYVPVDGTMNVTGGVAVTTTLQFTDTNVAIAESGTNDLALTADGGVEVTITGTDTAFGGTLTIDAAGFDINSINSPLYLNAPSGSQVIVAINEVAEYTFSNSSLTVAAGNAVNASVGTGTAAPLVGGTLDVNTTAIGNVDAGEDVLISYTLPASSLVATGRGIRVHARGTFANNANVKTLKCKVGTQIVLTNVPTISVLGVWAVDYTFTRTGASTQDWEAEYQANTGAAGAFVYDPELGTATQTETGTMAVHCTGEGVATNDIVMEFQSVEAF